MTPAHGRSCVFLIWTLVSEDNIQGTLFLRACHSESSSQRLVGKQCCPHNALGTGVPLYLDVLCRRGPEEPCPN